MNVQIKRNADADMPTTKEMRKLYSLSAKRALKIYGLSPLRVVGRLDHHPIFIVGSPRSGTTFTAKSIGSVPGLADLGELLPWKRVIPVLYGRSKEESAARLRAIVGRSQRLGMLGGLNVIEQTPESTFMIDTILRAFPGARFVHLVRDGRDVAASLIGLGWLRQTQGRTDRDDAGHSFGGDARFWVEPGQQNDFMIASEATRAAWVWQRYESQARSGLGDCEGRSFEIRYEHLLDHPDEIAQQLSSFLGVPEREREFARAFAGVDSSARGRWQRDLTEEQLEDVLERAGTLLETLEYVS